MHLAWVTIREVGKPLIKALEKAGSPLSLSQLESQQTGALERSLAVRFGDGKSADEAPGR